MTDTPDLEILGLISTQYASETHPAKSGLIDKAYLAAHAKAHEYAGFDRVLIGYNSASPDGFQVAAYAAQQTEKLKFLLAHRPGVTSPTVAARQLATLDHLSDGRLAVHIITGGSDEEQQRDGDFLTKEERYARTDDYITVLKKAWTSNGPFDHDGPHYRVKGAPAAVKTLQQPHLPVFFGGSSDEALEIAGRQADVYALFGETVEQVREIVGRVRAAAAQNGREIKFSLSLRPILGRTEEDAWARAERILEDAKALKAAGGGAPTRYATARGGQRLLEAAAGGKVRDKRLWTEIAALTGAQGNSTSLVGTPEQVVDSLLDYYDLGITKFLFRGFDPLEDAIEYGRELLPQLRAAVAQRGAPKILAAE
ncbi:MAG: alkanesulfonate monooxygenase [Phenylobacterium sp.]|uniref:LLM class flavin-dependent oxidoreductase n=1 Tax=Phenylobacterium sp. TaxID=1871053 RepID=UPI0025FF92C4|nr:LLM class flavin-dependent oxidoreductase [Phenylobacterium sp.]MBA4010315.1 alkanesulfonate monooxygenase [Phenylobacterium sp.]